MRRFLGVDPGTSGAVAVLDVFDDGTQVLIIHATPCDWVQVGTGKRRRYAVDQCAALLRSCATVSLAYLEQQSARPKQGVASSFQTGFGYGIWVALLTAATVPFAVVPPPRWRAKVGLASHPKGTEKKAIKDAVRLAACRRFPTVPITLEHADAVMLAVAASLEHESPLAASRRALTH